MRSGSGARVSCFGAAASAAEEAPLQADLAIVSNTASVRHAKVGDIVEFTVVATNFGPDAQELDVSACPDLNACPIQDGLQLETMTCGGLSNPSPDTSVCEYISPVEPGGVAVVTVGARVAPDTGKRATFTACVLSFGVPYVDPSPANDCATATVRVIGKRK
jgi:Domain of unknown function DUF11